MGATLRFFCRTKSPAIFAMVVVLPTPVGRRRVFGVAGPNRGCLCRQDHGPSSAAKQSVCLLASDRRLWLQHHRVRRLSRLVIHKLQSNRVFHRRDAGWVCSGHERDGQVGRIDTRSLLKSFCSGFRSVAVSDSRKSCCLINFLFRYLFIVAFPKRCEHCLSSFCDPGL